MGRWVCVEHVFMHKAKIVFQLIVFASGFGFSCSINYTSSGRQKRSSDSECSARVFYVATSAPSAKISSHWPRKMASLTDSCPLRFHKSGVHPKYAQNMPVARFSSTQIPWIFQTLPSSNDLLSLQISLGRGGQAGKRGPADKDKKIELFKFQCNVEKYVWKGKSWNYAIDV